MNIHDFAQRRPYFFWYTRDVSSLSESAIVEGTLNYGDFDDIKQMISILGIQKVARIFRDQVKQKRVNYDPKIAHYFRLYFQKHA